MASASGRLLLQVRIFISGGFPRRRRARSRGFTRGAVLTNLGRRGNQWRSSNCHAAIALDQVVDDLHSRLSASPAKTESLPLGEPRDEYPSTVPTLCRR